MNLPAEKKRLKEHASREANWKRWGPYLSERAWGTVREDYSEDGEAWEHFTYDQARSRVYRWNEDGIAGISDRNQRICLALSFWNGRDPFLKERFFGLTNRQGNHGEDVKEYYFYLDNTPTHSYMKMLYKYPHQAFPYEKLIQENQRRTVNDPEYELLDTGIFNEMRYFDILIEYAKASEKDILLKVTAINRGQEKAFCQIIPTIWFRKRWGFGYPNGPWGDMQEKPNLAQSGQVKGGHAIRAYSPDYETYFLYVEGNPEIIFTENETNFEKLYGSPNITPYVKDAFHRYVVDKEMQAINPNKIGTKAAALYGKNLEAGEAFTVCLRLTTKQLVRPFTGFDKIVKKRKQEADAFYSSIQNPRLNDDQKRIQRQAFAGLLWSKQLYYFDFEQWKEGDTGPSSIPAPPRKIFKNKGWEHLINFDLISMPDKWEYPWYASWDLAFHSIPFALIDPQFAKRQLLLMTREWYMHPNGQLPAYEWNFNDVNPPTLVWAAWRTYKIDQKLQGKADRAFLEAIFHKLLLNFTWWVNRKDRDGNNIFQGGFLGLDNISLFDRSSPVFQGKIDQADGTAWMSFFCIILMKIALELAAEDPVYQDSASKLLEHFFRISSAVHNCGKKGFALWNEEDGFFYDALHTSGEIIPLKIRSLVGLLPLFAVETLEPEFLNKMPTFKSRLEWFISKRPNYTHTMACIETPGIGRRRLLSLLRRDQLLSVLKYLLDENEFLSEFGIRSLSKYHQEHPYTLNIEGQNYLLNYQPGDSESKLFGGNSNWRGPIWLPINFLIIESLQKFHHYYGDDLKVAFPTGSKNFLNLSQVANELSKRLIKLFTLNKEGQRAIYGKDSLFNSDPHWKDLILFHEFFHGDSGLGLGASHQTGWTALIAKLLQQASPV